jgi:hypothetical protein
MKRTLPILAVLAFLAFLAAPTSAQPRPRDVWVGGITLGPNYSKLSGSYIESSDWLQNPMVGGWFEYRDHDNFSVALEFNWLRKGGKNIITTAGDTLSTLEVGYLEFPLILTAMLPVGERWDWGIYSGATLAFQTSCNVLPKGATRREVCKDASGTEWSIPFGGGFAYYMPESRGALILDLRYSLGVDRIFEDRDVKTNSWQFLLRYTFGL